MYLILPLWEKYTLQVNICTLNCYIQCISQQTITYINKKYNINIINYLDLSTQVFHQNVFSNNELLKVFTNSTNAKYVLFFKLIKKESLLNLKSYNDELIKYKIASLTVKEIRNIYYKHINKQISSNIILNTNQINDIVNLLFSLSSYDELFIMNLLNNKIQLTNFKFNNKLTTIFDLLKNDILLNISNILFL